RPAFTLVELIVATVVGALVAGGAVVSMSQLLKVKARSLGRQQAFDRAEAAASRIAFDARCIVRHHDLKFGKVQVIDRGSGDEARAELLMLIRTLRPVRGRDDAPESPEHEVQYRVIPGGPADPRPALWRREDPVPDQYLDSGGVATPVVPGVRGL